MYTTYAQFETRVKKQRYPGQGSPHFELQNGERKTFPNRRTYFTSKIQRLASQWNFEKKRLFWCPKKINYRAKLTLCHGCALI